MENNPFKQNFNGNMGVGFCHTKTEHKSTYKKSHLITGKVGVDINCFCVLLFGVL